jgi:hypothetical protein
MELKVRHGNTDRVLFDIDNTAGSANLYQSVFIRKGLTIIATFTATQGGIGFFAIAPTV